MMESGLKDRQTGQPAYWQHFDHDADIGIRSEGPSVEDAFVQSALALTAVVTEEEVEALTAVEIACEAPDLETLYLDWLNALVYEMATRGFLFSRFDVRIEQNTGYGLQATAWGESIDQARHKPVVEVKGATYTELSVMSHNGSWRAQCVLDV